MARFGELALAIVLPTLAACGDSAESAVAAQLGEGEAVRFQNLRRTADYLCGDANVRAAGSFEGYRRFIYDRAAGRTVREPIQPSGAAPPAPANPACAQREAYKTAMDRFACAPTAEGDQPLDARSFDQLWTRVCG